MQRFLSNPEFGYLELKLHCLALAIAKKTLDENRFKYVQKMTNCTPSNFKVGNREFFKNVQHGKWGLKWRDGYRIVHTGHNRCYLHIGIENQATGKMGTCNVKDVLHELPVELSNVNTMFGRAGKFINHQANLPTIPLNTT